MFLYKLFDSIDELVYVGITTDPDQRFKSHAHNSHWWGEVHRREVIEVGGAEAAELERKAIRTLLPRHNKTSMPNKRNNRAIGMAHSRARDAGATVIKTATPKTKYGVSTHISRRPRLAHLPHLFFLGWRDGRIISATARWHCGGVVTKARLTDSAAGTIVCQRCVYEAQT